MNAWVCPKCGRVWGPFVMECKPCNAPVVTTTTTQGWVPPIKRSTIEMQR